VDDDVEEELDSPPPELTEEDFSDAEVADRESVR